MGRIPQNYIENLYAGWLGKLIGIRYGAPVESWTEEKIRKTYGSQLNGYLVNYDDFGADDDSNGPLFFLRALGDYHYTRDLTPQEIGLTWLNYAPWGHGFYWWGGYGNSTEHTAYLNLRSGMEAPRSGSIEQNGAVVAEQIGGQIFIDTWGLTIPNDPALAVEYARKAASVGHDRNGIYGGLVIAAAVSCAFVEKDIYRVIDRALSFIPEDSEYMRMAADVKRYAADHPEDWRACFRMIRENYGYDRYPGNCHIIPNAAVVLMSLLYSGGNFERGLDISVMAGWDTDCNAGNVGAVLGTLVGLKGIDYQKWIRPLHDLTICSSVIGDLNSMDIPYAVRYMACYAYKIAEEEVPAEWKAFVHLDPNRFDFELPGSTHGFRIGGTENCSVRNTEEQAASGRRSLCIQAQGMRHLRTVRVYRKTYYQPPDLYDGRNAPAFSPTVYPGETITCLVRPSEESAGRVKARMYAVDSHTGEEFPGEEVLLEKEKWSRLSMTIPRGEGRISRTGVMFTAFDPSNAGQFGMVAFLDDFEVTGEADYAVDFSKENYEDWPVGGRQLSQFTYVKGIWQLEGDRLHGSCADFAEAYTGRHNFKNYIMEAELSPRTEGSHQMNFRVQGAVRSYAAALCSNNRLVLRKNENGYRDLAEAEFEWCCGETYHLRVEAVENRIRIFCGDKMMIDYTDPCPYLEGAAGFSVTDGGSCDFSRLSIRILKAKI